MNSRRFIAAPRLQSGNRTGKDQCTERGHRCPLWVISGHSAVQKGMSALPPKADICSAPAHVRYGQLRTWVGRLLAVENTTRIDAGVTMTVGNVQTCLPVRFVASLSLGVVTSSNVATFAQGDLLMRLSSTIRAVLVALTVTGTGLATAAYAASGSIRFNVIKAGFIIGGSAGSGTLVFHGRRYPLSIGGVSYGFTFGGAATDFIG